MARPSNEEKEEALLTARENAAIEQLEDEGWTIGLHTPREYIEADPLLEREAGWRAGVCVATVWATDGRVKNVTGVSAVHVLDQCRTWLKWQSNIEPPMRFVPVRGERVAVPVFQREGSERLTKQRHDGNEKRIVSFASGHAELVDHHGATMGNDNQASSFATAEQEIPT